MHVQDHLALGSVLRDDPFGVDASEGCWFDPYPFRNAGHLRGTPRALVAEGLDGAFHGECFAVQSTLE